MLKARINNRKRNVRSLYMTRIFAHTIRDMKGLKIDILGFSQIVVNAVPMKTVIYTIPEMTVNFILTE